MSKAPLVREVMTGAVITANPKDLVAMAMQTMMDREIRHLPVVRDGKLVGLITERDVKLAMSLARDSSRTFTVEDIYLPEPFTVTPDEVLAKVLNRMRVNHIDAALVVEGEKVKGIFTAMDAVKLLEQSLS